MAMRCDGHQWGGDDPHSDAEDDVEDPLGQRPAALVVRVQHVLEPRGGGRPKGNVAQQPLVELARFDQGHRQVEAGIGGRLEDLESRRSVDH